MQVEGSSDPRGKVSTYTYLPIFCPFLYDCICTKQKLTIVCQLECAPVCLRAFRFTSPVSLCLCACVVPTTYYFSRCHLLLIQHVSLSLSLSHSLSLSLSLPHTEYVSLSGLRSFHFLPIYHLILGPYTVLFPVNPAQCVHVGSPYYNTWKNINVP